MRITILPSLALALASLSCLDPVHSDAVDALGGEAPGVRRGPNHRPGQPCLVCHGPDGPGRPEMSVAGTVFDVRGSTVAAQGAEVTITDATGNAQTLIANGAGNFYAFKTEWDPVFPLRSSVSYESSKKDMTSRIGRDGSCATCHVGNGSTLQMPGVFAKDAP
jgi:hypothetical protein